MIKMFPFFFRSHLSKHISHHRGYNTNHINKPLQWYMKIFAMVVKDSCPFSVPRYKFYGEGIGLLEHHTSIDVRIRE